MGQRNEYDLKLDMKMELAWLWTRADVTLAVWSCLLEDKGVEFSRDARIMSLPISSDYWIVPSNNLNQTIKIYLYATNVVAPEMGHTTDITWQVKVNKLENCMQSFKDTHLMHEQRI